MGSLNVVPVVGFVLLLVSWQAALVEGQCRLRLDVVDAGTTLRFSGVSSHSMVKSSFPVSLKSPAPKVGLSGALFAYIPTGSCPTTAAGWLQAAPKLQLTSSPSPYLQRPVEVTPPMLYAGVFGVPLNISSMAMNLTLQGTPTPPSNGAVPMDITAVVARGFVYSNTVQTGGASLEAMANTSDSNTTAVRFAVNGTGSSQVLTITLPDVYVHFLGKTQGINPPGSAFSGPWTGSLDTVLQGQVQLSAPLGCGLDCGAWGRCRLVGGTPVCECECGWQVSNTTGSCDIPQGSCPAFASDLMGSKNFTLVSVNGSGGGGSSAASGPGGTCATGYGFDMMTKTCSRCPTGFSGSGCKACLSDSVCQTQTGSTAAICASGLAYAARTAGKHYSCRPVSDDILQVVGAVLPFSCYPQRQGNITQGTSAMAADASSLASSYCDINFRLGSMPAGQVAQCTASSCHFATGQPDFVCDQVKCSCPNGCVGDGQDYRSTLEGITGKVILSCDAKTSNCGLNVGSLDVKLELNCEAAECLNPDGPVTVGNDLPQQEGANHAKPAVAAIPLMLLVLGGVVCAAMMVRVLPYLKGAAGRKPAAAAGKTARGPLGEGAEQQQQQVGHSNGEMVVAAPCSSPSTSSFSEQGQQGGTRLTLAGHGTQRLLQLLPVSHSLKQLSFHDIQVQVQVPRGFSWFRKRGSGAAAYAAAAAAGAHHQQVTSSTAQLDELEKGLSAPVSKSNSTAQQLPAVDAVPPPAAAAAAGSAGAGGLPQGEPGWKQVLHGISGQVAAGQVMGVLGPSGCGKSTLLMRLTGSMAGDKRYRTAGRVCIDGTPVTAKQLVALTAVVPQDDLLLRSLTVEECLTYSAVLRLDPSLPASVVKSKVDAVLEALGLDHVRSSIVWSGTGHVSVSGGERRRAAIGMELVTDPFMLVLDEPTSGLDASTALQLLGTLQAVASSGRAVLMSLHQPSPLLFNGLDQAMLMAAGQMVYFGPPKAAGEGMAQLGLPVPEGVTVAEHLLQVVSDPTLLHRLAAATGSQGLCHTSQQQQQKQQQHQIVAAAGGDSSTAAADGPHHHHRRASSNGGSSMKPAALLPGSMGRCPLGREVGVLFWRSMIDMLRNPLLTAFHALGGLVLGLLVGALFFQVRNDTSGAQNRVGAIFFALSLLGFTSVTSIDMIQAERVAAGREMRRNYYRPASYAATKLILDGLLLRALPALLYSIPFYFLMGLHPGAGPFFSFLFVFVAFNAAVGALALGLAAALDSPGKTIILMNLVLLVGVAFSGFLANKAVIPWALRWLTYVSIFRYAWESMVINELSGLYLYFTAPNISITVAVKGEMFLQILGVDPGMLMTDIAVLVAMYVACALFVVGVMWWRYGRRREQ